MIATFKRSLVWAFLFTLVTLLTAGISAFGADGDYPAKPNPPQLVNDYAGVLNGGQRSELERKLVDFDRNTSNQVTIVVIRNLGGRDVQEYSLELFNRWGIGTGDKQNGVLLFASIEDHKAWITVGRGLQGVLMDGKAGEIFRNEIAPNFRNKDYYAGLSAAADAIIAVTKGEYKGDAEHYGKKSKPFPGAAIIVIIIVIVFVVKMMGRGGGGGGGSHMSGGGFGDFATGWLIGSLLSGGRRGGGWGGDGGGSDWGGGGGGFGGFGGGSSDGGGAGGSW